MENWNPQPLDPGLIELHRRGTGKPIVLIHCLGQSRRFWDVLDPLADRNELVTYSLPGHPGTALPGHQYGVPELTEQLRKVALRDGLTKFHLMGISLGGSVAQHFAGTYPDMVDRLVLADCSPRYDDESRANWPVRAAAARKDGVKSLIPFLLQVFFTADFDCGGWSQRAPCAGDIRSLRRRGLRVGLRGTGDARRAGADQKSRGSDADPARLKRAPVIQGCGASGCTRRLRQARSSRCQGRPRLGAGTSRIRCRTATCVPGLAARKSGGQAGRATASRFRPLVSRAISSVRPAEVNWNAAIRPQTRSGCRH